jgi:hypothetical protein
VKVVADNRHDELRIAAMEQQLRRSHLEPAYFHGYLMLPHLREGDEVEVEPVTGGEVRVGDVVTYRDADRFPTRRVMEIRHDERVLVIMGDSVRPRRTWSVSFDDVIARVVRRRRDGTWMTTSDLRWRAQRSRVLTRYRVAATPIGAVVRRVRRRG